MSELSDADLLKRTACGDTASFEVFVKRHSGALFRYLCTLLAHHADAEDVMQQTFTVIWQQAHTVRVLDSARGFVFTIARHTAFRLGRLKVGQPSARHMESIQELGENAGFATIEAPDVLLMHLEQKQWIINAMATLHKDDQDILMLRDMEGFLGPEAAGILGITLEAEKSRIHRARLRLQAALREALKVSLKNGSLKNGSQP